jgi:hypothetical protein
LSNRDQKKAVKIEYEKTSSWTSSAATFFRRHGRHAPRHKQLRDDFVTTLALVSDIDGRKPEQNGAE